MKTINGKRYEQVFATDMCEGCAFDNDLSACANMDGNCTGKIWKEVEMKTALELVELVIQDCCPGSPPFCRAVQLKAAIEREQAELVNKCLKIDMEYFKRLNQHESAITMRPISELPDRVPEGCVVVKCHAWNTTGIFVAGSTTKVPTNATHFYILPLPVAPRKLHPCYMPGCGGEAKTVMVCDAARAYRKCVCKICGASGPVKPTKEEAEKSWGYNEQA